MTLHAEIRREFRERRPKLDDVGVIQLHGRHDTSHVEHCNTKRAMILTKCATHCSANRAVYSAIMRAMNDDTTSPGERLRALRMARGYETARHFARAAGRSESSVLMHERDERGITPRMACTYARLLKTTPEALLYGKQFNQDIENATLNKPQGIAPTGLPLLSCLDIEQFRSIARGAIPMSDELTFVPAELDCGKRSFTIKVSDKSMECASREAIFEGEIVVIDPEREYAAGDIVAAVAPGFDGIILRKYRVNHFDEENHPIFDLVSLNPDYPSVLNAHAGNVDIVGRVISATRVI